jgi:hypothetical protein
VVVESDIAIILNLFAMFRNCTCVNAGPVPKVEQQPEAALAVDSPKVQVHAVKVSFSPK